MIQGGMSCQTSAPKESTVFENVARQAADEISRLDDLTLTLVRRLESVLRPSSPSISKGSPPDVEVSNSQVVQVMCRVRERVAETNARITDLLDRLEV